MNAFFALFTKISKILPPLSIVFLVLLPLTKELQQVPQLLLDISTSSFLPLDCIYTNTYRQFLVYVKECEYHTEKCPIHLSVDFCKNVLLYRMYLKK